MSNPVDLNSESNDSSLPEPTPRGERILPLDVVRGVAVLGILLMNMPSFGLPIQAYDRPRALGGTWLDVAVWWVIQVFFEGKMRALFSMLFGAGVILFTLERPARRESVADLYFRRILLLTVLGYLHGKFFWEGDILFIYGTVGMVLFVFRNLSARVLIILGLLVMWWSMAHPVWDAMDLVDLRSDAQQAQKLKDSGKELTEQEEKDLKKWEEKLNSPSTEEMADDIAQRRGGYWSNYRRRSTIIGDPAIDSMSDSFLDALMAMLFGMALYKQGFFFGDLPRSYYVRLMLLGYGLGIPLSLWLASYQIATNFTPGETDLFQALGYQPTRIAIALGHACFVILLVQSRKHPWLVGSLAAVGQMALTNYLMQTLLCTTFFYGYGFGWFGYLGRAQLLLVVIAVWVLELLWSKPWLSRFQFGPAEYIWRWLTYLHQPPLLRQDPTKQLSPVFLSNPPPRVSGGIDSLPG